MIPPLWQKWRRTKELLDESERGEWKSWLKTQHSENWDHDIWSHHFMVNRWGNNGNSEKFYFLGLQNHCRWWLQSWNLKKAWSLEEKLWPITLPPKVHLVKAMIFPEVMYGCESWTVEKAECWRIDAFKLWCWKRLLSVPLTARRSNQSIL